MDRIVGKPGYPDFSDRSQVVERDMSVEERLASLAKTLSEAAGELILAASVTRDARRSLLDAESRLGAAQVSFDDAHRELKTYLEAQGLEVSVPRPAR